jgi:histidinol-phosphatase (PHP family)
VLDYHVHLWPHSEASSPMSVGELEVYCERAAARGVQEIALTEHLFRFRQARDRLGDFWRDEPDPKLRALMQGYWDHHAHADLDEYVEVVLAAKAAGLPVVLGLEVDHYPGKMDVVAGLLAGYPFDVLLGSVHWLGSWMFDWIEDPASMAQWGLRGVDAVWDAYVTAVEELADSGVCDVLAHPDLAKVAGHRPGAPSEFHHRIAEAAASSAMAAEVSSAGWRKPAAEQYPSVELLELFYQRDVPVTTASDTHGPELVAHRHDDLRALLAGVGYDQLAAFRGRARVPAPLSGPLPERDPPGRDVPAGDPAGRGER